MLTHVRIHACVFELHGCNVHLCILVLVSDNSFHSIVSIHYCVFCYNYLNVYTLFISFCTCTGVLTFYNEYFLELPHNISTFPHTH